MACEPSLGKCGENAHLTTRPFKAGQWWGRDAFWIPLISREEKGGGSLRVQGNVRPEPALGTDGVSVGRHTSTWQGSAPGRAST